MKELAVQGNQVEFQHQNKAEIEHIIIKEKVILIIDIEFVVYNTTDICSC